MLIPTRENAAVLFLDLQEEILKNSRIASPATPTLSPGKESAYATMGT